MKKGSTLGWATTFTSDAIDNKKFKTFTDFKNSLTKAFLTTNLKAKALACLQSITQIKDEILPYINKFKITVHPSGIVNQTDLISLFAEELNPALMHCIYSMDFIPSTSTGKTKDPNDMDIDAICVRKLTPEEWKICIEKGLCFHY